MKIGIAQIAPVWLNRKATTEKICDWIRKAGESECELIVFGETLLPGYPFWIEHTDGAKFNSGLQKEIYAIYLDQSVSINRGDLDPIRKMAKQYSLPVYLGCVERADDRGGHSVFCSLVYINPEGELGSVHRKLMPTYEERIVWAIGDGHGLVTHRMDEFTVGGLNCWENWMPLSRTALYAQGEDLHVAVWPGSRRNTIDITRYIAQESRSFVISASGLMRKSDIPKNFPGYEAMVRHDLEFFADGGSCIAAPDGQWIVEPVVGEEILVIGDIQHQVVRQERHNFDVTGHYSRPDVTHLHVNHDRQNLLQKK